MGAEDRLAVVICKVTMAYNEKAQLHAARFAELGLTSFGDTPQQAVQRLKKLFKTFIHTQRELGVLEQRLNELEVEWYWHDEYPAEKPAYQNMNEPSNSDDGLQRVLDETSSVAQNWQPEGDEEASIHQLVAA